MQSEAKIPAAGVNVLPEQGHGRSSIADIAREMAVSTGVVTRQHRRAVNVFLAVMQGAHIEVDRQVSQIIACVGPAASASRSTHGSRSPATRQRVVVR